MNHLSVLNNLKHQSLLCKTSCKTIKMSMFGSLKQTVVMRKELILTSKIVEMLHGHKHLVLKE